MSRRDVGQWLRQFYGKPKYYIFLGVRLRVPYCMYRLACNAGIDTEWTRFKETDDER